MVIESMAYKIEYDLLEKSFKKKYYIIVVIILNLTIFIEIFLLKKDYFAYFFIFQAFLIFPFLPNLLFLKSIKCPHCNRNYFTPFFASKENIKNLLKSTPRCVNCGYESEIISEYKTMY